MLAGAVRGGGGGTGDLLGDWPDTGGEKWPNEFRWGSNRTIDFPDEPGPTGLNPLTGATDEAAGGPPVTVTPGLCPGLCPGLASGLGLLRE